MKYDKDFANTLTDSVIEITKHGEGTLFANEDKEIDIQTKFIYDIVSEIKPKKVLEIGTCFAHFDYFLLENFDCIKKILTIDYYKESYEAVKLLNEKYGNKVVFIPGRSENILPRINGRFDLAWIDGGHYYNTVYMDLDNCKRMNIKNILVDDSQKEVLAAINDFLRVNKNYKLIKTSNDARIISYLRK